jgi:hypothetical protein
LTAVATIALPAHLASSSATPYGSNFDARTNTSSALSSAGTRTQWPSSTRRSEIPSSAAWVSIALRSGPSPASTMRSRGSARAARANARSWVG